MTKTKVFRVNMKGKKFVFSMGKQYFSKNYYNIVIYKKGRSALVYPVATYSMNAKSIKDAFLSARDYFLYNGCKHESLFEIT